MTVFDEIRERVDIKDAAQRYGLHLSHNGRALCPFHQDRHPSLTFKYNRYRCWSCGAHGSVIDLTAHLCGVDILEAAKLLNQDYCLGLELDKPLKKEVITQRQKDERLYQAFIAWEKESYQVLSNYYRKLAKLEKKLQPTTTDAEPKEEYFIVLKEKDTVSYWLDILREGDTQDKIQLYKNYRQRVKELAGKIKCN